MSAVLSKTAAQTITDALERTRKRLRYEGGGPQGTALPPATDTLLADFNRMFDALTLVKADAAYASLAGGTKTAVEACGF